jgi:hypothetical protein
MIHLYSNFEQLRSGAESGGEEQNPELRSLSDPSQFMLAAIA